MNFLKEKVRKYQEKKLVEAQEKVKIHTEIKKNLKNKLNFDEGNIDYLKKEIEKQDEFLKIWETNVASIKQQIKKLGN